MPTPQEQTTRARTRADKCVVRTDTDITGYYLCVGKYLSVVQGYLKLGILAVEIILQSVQVPGTLPLAHRKVVKQIVAAGLRARSRNLGLGQDPLQTLNCKAAHVLNGV